MHHENETSIIYSCKQCGNANEFHADRFSENAHRKMGIKNH